MKVLQLCSCYGGTTVHRDLYTELDLHGITNYIYAPLRYNRRDRLGKHIIDFQCKDSKIVYSTLLKWYHTFLFRLKIHSLERDIVTKLDVNNCDLIHAITWFSDGALAYKLHKRFRKDYIVAIRNSDINAFYERRKDLRSLGAKILRSAKYIIFLSEAYKNIFFQKCVKEQDKESFSLKSLVISNGLSNEWFIGCHSNQNLGNPLKVGFAGRLENNKNVLKAWEAVDILNKSGIPALLLVAGDGEKRKILEEKKNTKLFGYISSVERLKSFYDECDIFLLPSLHETFGLVYLEAMSRGLPVLYTRGQGFDGWFPEGYVGYSIDPHNPNEMADRIRKCLDNYRQISENAVSGINQFKWNVIAERYNDLYKNILQKR